MKKIISTSALLLFLCNLPGIHAQSLAPDQNPQFAISRTKYMAIADSVNRLHSTTVHDTYKAYDWYEARMEKRQLRQQFRRELRLERARSRTFYHRNYGYQHPYNFPVRAGYHRINSPWSFWWW